MPSSVVAHRLSDVERTEDIAVNDNVSFDALMLSDKTLDGLKKAGFVKPSPIQFRAIPLGRCGIDLIIEAKSGTGKTLVFGTIALEMIINNGGLQVLILAPTREIASQIGHVLKTIGSSYEDLHVEIVMGGTKIVDDMENLKSRKFQILVGSPGRIHHLLKKKIISTKSIRLLILDEADKLMQDSFIKDINYIFSNLPERKQLIAASATYTSELKEFLARYMRTPSHVCPYISTVLLGVSQHTTLVPASSSTVRQNKIKLEKTMKILSEVSFKQCLIFCRYQMRAQSVCEALCDQGWPTEFLAGNQNQSDRLISLEKLQSFSCRILVSTDLAARGIDASNVDLIINLDPPDDYSTYLHRIGRAGRYGSKGKAITILSEDEVAAFNSILDSIGDANVTPFELLSSTIAPKTSSEHEPVDTIDKQLSDETLDNTLSILTMSQKCNFADEPFESILSSFNSFKSGDTIFESENIFSEKNIDLLEFIKSQSGNIEELGKTVVQIISDPKEIIFNDRNAESDKADNIIIELEENAESRQSNLLEDKTENQQCNLLEDNYTNKVIVPEIATVKKFHKKPVTKIDRNVLHNPNEKKNRKRFTNHETDEATIPNHHQNSTRLYTHNDPESDYKIWRQRLDMMTRQIQYSVYINSLLKIENNKYE